MEFAACLVGGVALMICGAGLFRLRPPDWQADGELSEDELRAILRWSLTQRIVRILNNSLMILIGGLIVSTAFVPHGHTWMLIWSVILLSLMMCILLAMIDAFSSLAGYKRALPEAARRSFSSHEMVPVPLESITGDTDQL